MKWDYLKIVDYYGGCMDFIVSGVIGLAVLGYLTYVLFNPEKF